VSDNLSEFADAALLHAADFAVEARRGEFPPVAYDASSSPEIVARKTQPPSPSLPRFELVNLSTRRAGEWCTTGFGAAWVLFAPAAIFMRRPA